MRIPFDAIQGLVQCLSCGADGAQSEAVGVLDGSGRLFSGDVFCTSCGASMFRASHAKWHSCDRKPGEDRPRVEALTTLPSLVRERLVPASAAETALVGPWVDGPAEGSWLSAGEGCSATAKCDAEWASALLLSHPGGGPVHLLIDGALVDVVDTHQASGSAWIEVPFPGTSPGVEVAVRADGPLVSAGFAGFVFYTDQGDGRYSPMPAFNNGNPYSPFIEPKLQALDPLAMVLEIGGGNRRRRNPRHINVEYAPFRGTDLVADVHQLPFRSNSFDAVVSQAVFEHLAQPFDAAAELMRVLKPGGLMVCEVAFLQPLHGVPFHYFNMTLDGVAELFPGLRDTTREWFGSLADTVAWMLGAVGASGRVESSVIDGILGGLRDVDARMRPEDYLPVASGVVLAGRKIAST